MKIYKFFKSNYFHLSKLFNNITFSLIFLFIKFQLIISYLTEYLRIYYNHKTYSPYY